MAFPPAIARQALGLAIGLAGAAAVGWLLILAGERPASPPAALAPVRALALPPVTPAVPTAADSGSESAPQTASPSAPVVHDRTDALARAAELPTPEERHAAFEEICLELAQTDPAAALATAWQLGLGRTPESFDDGAILGKLARRWAATDFSAALTWVCAQPATGDDPRAGRTLGTLVELLAESDPAAAAGLVAEHLPPDGEHFRAALAVLRHWAVQDPSAAAAWAAQFPSGLRELAAQHLARARP